ncbi:hypothetical protein [Actinoplanes sp. NPDC051851]|uniref:hypothetical protein n=1 Tax=Actinoplanes sp. NPDC051851 TaxID=3154753 RepID=UPI003421F4BE
MTIPEPTGRPDIERPIDLNDDPDRAKAGPAPMPEHHQEPDSPRTGVPASDK